MEKGRLLMASSYQSEGSSVPETASGSDAMVPVQATSCLRTYVICLMNLVPSMEDVLMYTDQINCDNHAFSPQEFTVSGPTRTYILNILDRFPKANSRLVERLGESNWQ